MELETGHSFALYIWKDPVAALFGDDGVGRVIYYYHYYWLPAFSDIKFIYIFYY